MKNYKAKLPDTIRYILLEDDYYTAVDLKRMIQSERPNYQMVAETDSVRKALQILTDVEADLIISDIHLSDGLSTEALRQSGCHVPVIFFTGYEQYRNRLSDFAPIDIVFKPITADDVRSSLGKYEQRMGTTIKEIFH